MKERAKKILRSMGEHFKGRCKAAARRLGIRFPRADAIGTGVTDGIVTVENIEQLNEIGRRRGDSFTRRAMAYSRTFGIPLPEAMMEINLNYRGMMEDIEDARMAGEAFLNDDNEPTQTYTSMETAYRTDSPDRRTSKDDVRAYKQQLHCTRGG